MPTDLKIGLAQFDFCVGDIKKNASKIIEIANYARRDCNLDIMVFPELALTGYPPEDLLLRPEFRRLVEIELGRIISESEDCCLIIGYPEYIDSSIYNSCAAIYQGEKIANYRKRELPNYAVFDEKRYFSPGTLPTIVDIKGIRVGLSVCEDIWVPENALETSEGGADIICNINASPYHIDKQSERLNAVATASRKAKVPVLYVNLLGGQDELVFDGNSFGMDKDGTLIAQAPAFEEALHVVDIKKSNGQVDTRSRITANLTEEEVIYKALILGIRAYVQKNQFEGCVIGLSGGIDSALTLALAVDALGSGKVTAISMPSAYTADMSIEDAREEATLLGCAFHVLPIEDTVTAFSESLIEIIPNLDAGVTKQNLQARTRGVMLMACSNAAKTIVLATGNKSEMAVGYATLYGDMAGGFAPLKDIPKTLVYRLSDYRNKQSYVIPSRVIERAPTAELAPNQKDTDNLPPYETLDPILEKYIEKDLTPIEISREGFDFDTVLKVAKLVDKNEYKRRQSAPGVRITRRAFGRDRRFPITSGYSETEP